MSKSWRRQVQSIRKRCSPDEVITEIRRLLGMAPTTPAGSTFVAMDAFLPEAKQQRESMASLGVHPVCWEQDHESARVTYCIPPGIVLGPQA